MSAQAHSQSTSPDSPGLAFAWQSLRRLHGMIVQSPLLAWAAAISTVVTTLMTVAIPLLTKDAINIATGQAEPHPWVLLFPADSLLVKVTALLITAAVVRFAFSFLRRVTAGRLSINTQHQVRIAMLEKINALDGPGLDKISRGQVASRSIADISTIQGVVAMLPLTMENALLVAASLAVMFTQSVALSMVAVVFLPLVLLAAVKRSRKLMAASWSAQQSVADFTSHAELTITGRQVVHACAAESREVERSRKLAEDVFATKMRSAQLAARVQPLVNALPSLMQVATLLFGGLLCLNGRMDLGTFVAFLALMAGLTGSVRMLAATVVRINQSLSSVTRVMDVLDLTPSLPQPVNPITLAPGQSVGIAVQDVSFQPRAEAPADSTAGTADTAGKSSMAGMAGKSSTAGTSRMPDAAKTTAVTSSDDEHAAYRRAAGLNNVSVDFPAGTTTVIVGGAQAGKSLLVSLLTRFYDPDHGQLAIVGGTPHGAGQATTAAGRVLAAGEILDFRELGSVELRRHMGVVFDEPFVFSASIADNIDMGRGLDREALNLAAHIACVDEFADELPDGLDTLVGERGMTLSGGQRQRVALARAIVGQPAIVILDDATSAIDAITEARIIRRLKERLTDTTVIAIAHRPTLVEVADRVVVMEHGRIVAAGDKDVIVDDPHYRQLMLPLEDSDEESTRADKQLTAADTQHNDDNAAKNYATVALKAAGSTDDVGSAEIAVPKSSHGVVEGSPLWNALWPREVARSDSTPGRGVPRGSLRQAMSRTGGMGGHRPAGMAAPTVATAELLEEVKKLPPATATPSLSEEIVAADMADEGRFTTGTLLRRVAPWIVFTTVLLLLSVGLDLAFPYLLQLTVDHGISTSNPSMVWLFAGIALLTIVGTFIVESAQIRATARTGETVLYSLRVRLVAHVLNQATDFFHRTRTGAILTRLTGDVDSLSSFFQSALAEAIVAATTLIGVTTMLGITSPKLALVALSLLPLVVVATWIFRKVAKKNYTSARTAITSVNTEFLQAVTTVKAIQVCGMQDASLENFQNTADTYRRIRNRGQIAIATYFPGIIALGEIATAIVVGVGASWVLQEQITAGVLVAFVLYMKRLFGPIRILSQLFDSYSQAQVGLQRIHGLLNVTPTIPSLAPATATAAQQHAAITQAAAAEAAARGDVCFNDVSFAYPTTPSPLAGKAKDSEENAAPQATAKAAHSAVDDNHDGLQVAGLNVTIPAGQTVAIVGPTGAGKTTLMGLLARNYDPVSGSITAGGVNITEFSSHYWRRHLGIVPQDPYLFPGTVADNISYGDPQASRQDITRAVDAVDAAEVVAALPQGMLTEVGDNGAHVSSGVRQLIALARAELTRPSIVIYDEATAVVDPATEERIIAAQKDLSQGRTALIIAHRLSTALNADRVLVVSAGRIIQDGSPQELAQTPGMFADMLAAREAPQPQ